MIFFWGKLHIYAILKLKTKSRICFGVDDPILLYGKSFIEKFLCDEVPLFASWRKYFYHQVG